MMLCTKCLHEYNRWTRRWGSDSNIQRSRDTGESGKSYDAEMTNR